MKLRHPVFADTDRWVDPAPEQRATSTVARPQRTAIATTSRHLQVVQVVIDLR